MLPQQFPSVQAAILMAPEELAEFLLRYLRAEPDGVPRHHRGNVLNRLADQGGAEFGKACAEAWSWLERAGLLIYSVTARNDGVFEPSRRARLVSDSHAFADLRQATLFSRELLHPVIAEQSYGLFLIGKYDLAVFAAFKALEIRVSEKSQCDGHGTDLMRKAFKSDGGPLTDPAAPAAEREAIAHLFAGAFGTFRNPVGHRNVTYRDAFEPAALLTLASHLMRMVEGAE
jgi:uncharacterized protein (TIGR02391 family)